MLRVPRNSGEVMITGAGHRRLHQEAESIKCSCSDSFLLFLKSRAPDHGMVSLLRCRVQSGSSHLN